jgi:NADH-quinone oxidoreductase subunit H
VDQLPWLGPIYLIAKVVILLYGLIWIRATLPRIRYDRLMAFGWKILFPLALLNVMLTAIGVVIFGGK